MTRSGQLSSLISDIYSYTFRNIIVLFLLLLMINQFTGRWISLFISFNSLFLVVLFLGLGQMIYEGSTPDKIRHRRMRLKSSDR